MSLKQKSNLFQKTASPEQIYFVTKSGITINPISEFRHLQRKGITDYSIIRFQRWYLEVDNNGNVTFYNKIIKDSELNESIAKTIVYFYNKLKAIK